jgi:protein gp37
MSENTAIEWADHTFNPWEGCQKVGPGCDHCYAETRNKRFNKGQAINWGPGAPRRRTGAANWKKPEQWQRQAAAFQAEHGRRQRVFCASLADVFDNAVDHTWRDDLWELIYSTPDLDWLLLTKRIGNVQGMLPARGRLPVNVWLGATITCQAEADRDIPKLLAVPARVRFLSMEPLLGSVSLRWLSAWPENAPTTAEHPSGSTDHLDGLRRLDWVIVGGESGSDARYMHPMWVRSLRDQCAAAGVPFLFKQWGKYTYAPIDTAENRPHICAISSDGEDWAISIRDGKISHLGPKASMWTLDQDGLPAPDLVEWFPEGKKAAGRLLDGIEHNGFPGGAT